MVVLMRPNRFAASNRSLRGPFYANHAATQQNRVTCVTDLKGIWKLQLFNDFRAVRRVRALGR
jgi:hypothetical protein